ncbi:B-cell receptor CD22-like [Salvelinus fontinalis]|uniref:B-cell receptor CD22-like n=1 Tax=Salvelinus fontinalis TaxID=8038 RepID=UPI002486379B|nr:B-cell receptor CD22-like [Salvelinus fontinalis]
MALRTAGSVLVVFLWSVTVVLGQDGWSVTYTTQSICTLKGSTVEMSCSYTYPSGTVTTTFWFTKNYAGGNPVSLSDDPDYKGRVTYHRDMKNGHTLRITDLRESDSSTYMFSFITDQTRWKYTGDPGVTLSVTGFQVEVTPEQYSEYKTLTCITTCTLSNPNPIYIWYKNGQHLDESTSPQYKYSVYSNYEDSYSCAVKGHEDLLSPAVCVQGQRCSRVTYTKRRICVLKGSTVDISCTYVGYYYTTSSFWFRSDTTTPEDLTTDPGYAGRVKYPDKVTGTYEGLSTLRITDLREEDAAEYRFTFKTYNFEWCHSFPGTTLSITDAPKNTSVSVSPSGEIVEDSSVTLTCSSDANPPVDKYTWYKKNGASLTGSEKTFLITNINSEDSGEYYCEAESIYGSLNSSSVSVDVQYGPKYTSVSVSPSGEIVEGSSVTLTCSSDANPPVDKYTWYKKNGTSPKASGQSYSITNIISEDRGEYYCEAENTIASMNSTTLKIIVAGKQTSVLTAAVGIIVVVLVLILCLSGLMWFRKKASTSTSNTRDTADDGQGDSSPVYDSISNMVMTSTAAQTAATDDQDDVHYASVHVSHSKNQEVPLYSTVQVPQSQKEDEDVQYAALKFNLPVVPPAAQSAEEDSSVLYSTVNKPRRPEHNKPRTKKTRTQQTQNQEDLNTTNPEPRRPEHNKFDKNLVYLDLYI